MRVFFFEASENGVLFPSLYAKVKSRYLSPTRTPLEDNILTLVMLKVVALAKITAESQFHITLSYSIVPLFGSGFHNTNYLEINKSGTLGRLRKGLQIPMD